MALALYFAETRWKGEGWHDFYSRVIRLYAVRQSPSYERLRQAALDARYFLWTPPLRSARRLVEKDLARIDRRVRAVCR